MHSWNSESKHLQLNTFVHKFLDRRLKGKEKFTADEASVVKFFRWRPTKPEGPSVRPPPHSTALNKMKKGPVEAFPP